MNAWNNEVHSPYLMIESIIAVFFSPLFIESSAGILGNRNFIVALVTVFVTLPLSLFRQLAKLAKVNGSFKVY